MPFKIVRNDITKMTTEAIVNTANDYPTVGTGCDHAVYSAAGYEELLAYRKKNIGFVKEGDVFITPGFGLSAKYIIHAVSPRFVDGKHHEETLLRSCYQKSLALAAQYGIRSIAFPLISTGGFGYPKEEGMRIAVDEIHAFLLHSDMQVILVVFDEHAARMGKNLYPDLEAYIDRNYVREKNEEEYRSDFERPGTGSPELGYRAEYGDRPEIGTSPDARRRSRQTRQQADLKFSEEEAPIFPGAEKSAAKASTAYLPENEKEQEYPEEYSDSEKCSSPETEEEPDVEALERSLNERMKHISDSFGQYLLYLIHDKGMKNVDVYKRAIVDKKVFSKIKNNPDYHPQKLTALCLCVGARLNMDETRDLLARAGYALSPCDKTDIIFSYFIENKIYNMIELDIQLEEHGLPCIIP